MSKSPEHPLGIVGSKHIDRSNSLAMLEGIRRAACPHLKPVIYLPPYTPKTRFPLKRVSFLCLLAFLIPILCIPDWSSLVYFTPAMSLMLSGFAIIGIALIGLNLIGGIRG